MTSHHNKYIDLLRNPNLTVPYFWMATPPFGSPTHFVRNSKERKEIRNAEVSPETPSPRVVIQSPKRWDYIGMRSNPVERPSRGYGRIDLRVKIEGNQIDSVSGAGV